MVLKAFLYEDLTKKEIFKNLDSLLSLKRTTFVHFE